MNEINTPNTILSDFDHADWPGVWREQLLRNWRCQEKSEMANFWSSKEKAKEFWRKIEAQIHFYEPILNQVNIKPGDRVLDIGGGPGTIAIPLAKKGAQVTVVEPAEGMVAVLSDNIASLKVSGISVIPTRWEDVPSESLGEPYDHIIACFSLGMPDIKDSVRKMVSVSRGKIYLIWFSGLSSWDQMMSGLCTGVCGSNYYSGPKSDLLYLILNQMNIYPDIINLRQDFFEHFDSFDSAVFQVLQRCGEKYPGKEDLVKEWVRTRLTKEGFQFVWKAEVIVSIIQWDNVMRESE